MKQNEMFATDGRGIEVAVSATLPAGAQSLAPRRYSLEARRESYDAIKCGTKITQQQRSVLDALEAGGLTREEIGEWLGWSGDTVRPRVDELMKKGFIEEAGEMRLTRRGKRAAVLRLAGER